jgi:hypothetical protein
MFKMIFRVAIAFAVVWMLAFHGSDFGFSQSRFAAVKHYFGWLDTQADHACRPTAEINKNRSARLPPVAPACTSREATGSAAM